MIVIVYVVIRDVGVVVAVVVVGVAVVCYVVDNAGVVVVDIVAGCSGSIVVFHGMVVVDYDVGVLLIVSVIHVARLYTYLFVANIIECVLLVSSPPLLDVVTFVHRIVVNVVTVITGVVIVVFATVDITVVDFVCVVTCVFLGVDVDGGVVLVDVVICGVVHAVVIIFSINCAVGVVVVICDTTYVHMVDNCYYIAITYYCQCCRRLCCVCP